MREKEKKTKEARDRHLFKRSQNRTELPRGARKTIRIGGVHSNSSPT